MTTDRTGATSDEHPHTDRALRSSASMGCEAIEQLFKDGGALLAGGGRVGGTGDVQGALVKSADQYVGQGLDRLGRDGAGVYRRLERVLQQAEAVAVGKVPPGLPAKHSRAVQ
jgi:hypothetical protein